MKGISKSKSSDGVVARSKVLPPSPSPYHNTLGQLDAERKTLDPKLRQ